MEKFVIGKCPIKGCKSRKRGEYSVVRGAKPYPYIFPATAANHSKRPQDFEFFEAMKNRGFYCENHDRLHDVKVIRGTFNHEKKCDARCENASGPSCDCSCGGKNHGKTWQ